MAAGLVSLRQNCRWVHDEHAHGGLGPLPRRLPVRFARLERSQNLGAGLVGEGQPSTDQLVDKRGVEGIGGGLLVEYAGEMFVGFGLGEVFDGLGFFDEHFEALHLDDEIF